MIGFVYMWTNIIDNKKYIGVHCGGEDDGYVGSGVYFKRAVEKYGIENFERVILYKEFENVENLWLKEHEIINEYNAVHSDNFYNLTNYSPKQKILSENRTRKVSEDTKQKMSLNQTGRIKIHKIIDGKKVIKSVYNVIPFLIDGWVIGSGFVSSKTREKMSKQRKGKESRTKGPRNGVYGKKWYNNGIDTKAFIPGAEPSGWELGSLTSGHGKTKGPRNGMYGKKWYNNGIDTKAFIPGTEPLEWKLGSLTSGHGKTKGPRNGMYGKNFNHTVETKLLIGKDKKNKIGLFSPQGKKKFIEKSQLDDFLKQGYYNSKYKEQHI